ncbi:hypothetical protein ACLOJK_010908 [Asimina triloba]
MQSRSPHAAFFSSLKQVEKRLASEDNTIRDSKNPLQDPLSSPAYSTESLGPPIYLGHHQNPTYNRSISTSSSLRPPQDSDPPQEFLPHSIDFSETEKDPPQPDDSKHDTTTRNGEGDDIEQLMALLGLSSDCGHGRKRFKSVSSLRDGGFYAKVAGVRGPKCEKEMERLEGWIGYFLNGGGKKEPFRLAHLLLGKAAIMDETDLGGMDFPATVEEFLHNDPPTAYHKEN